METWFKGAKGLTILDFVITLCIIGVLTGIVIPKYRKTVRMAQETALRAELSNIRTSIRLFRMLNSRNPDSLREMMEKKAMIPGRTGADLYSGSFFEKSYLSANAVDAEGNKVDAFGNLFSYDKTHGELRTTTKGYENW